MTIFDFCSVEVLTRTKSLDLGTPLSHLFFLMITSSFILFDDVWLLSLDSWYDSNILRANA